MEIKFSGWNLLLITIGQAPIHRKGYIQYISFRVKSNKVSEENWKSYLQTNFHIILIERVSLLCFEVKKQFVRQKISLCLIESQFILWQFLLVLIFCLVDIKIEFFRFFKAKFIMYKSNKFLIRAICDFFTIIFACSIIYKICQNFLLALTKIS